MGAGQALALQPGVSRSGVTITVGRFVGLSRDGAARFAFLMSLPITAGALLFKWFDVQGDGGIPAGLRGAVRLGHRRLGRHRLHRGVGHAQAHPHPLVPPVRAVPARARRLDPAAAGHVVPLTSAPAASRPGRGRGRPCRWRRPGDTGGARVGDRHRDGLVAHVDHRRPLGQRERRLVAALPAPVAVARRRRRRPSGTTVRTSTRSPTARGGRRRARAARPPPGGRRATRAAAPGQPVGGQAGGDERLAGQHGLAHASTRGRASASAPAGDERRRAATADLDGAVVDDVAGGQVVGGDGDRAGLAPPVARGAGRAGQRGDHEAGGAGQGGRPPSGGRRGGRRHGGRARTAGRDAGTASSAGGRGWRGKPRSQPIPPPGWRRRPTADRRPRAQAPNSVVGQVGDRPEQHRADDARRCARAWRRPRPS